MAYHQTAEDEHDADDEDEDDEHGYIAIGEPRSDEDGQLASLILFEHGIHCELAHSESEVDEMRRFFEGWHAGQHLLVRPQDAARALTLAGSKLAPTQVWTDETLYLEQLPTEHLLKLLDFRDLWKEPTLDSARRVLAVRGLQYPPEGVSSWALPVVCLVLGTLFGPLGDLMRWRIDKTRQTKDRGERPHYSDKTRQTSERCLMTGLVLWCVLILAAFVFSELHPRR